MALATILILALVAPILRKGRRYALSQPVRGHNASAAPAAGETRYFGALEREHCRVASYAVPAWSPDGRLLAAGGDDLLVLWDSVRRATVRTWCDPPVWIYTLAWSPTGRILATAGSDTITLWDGSSGRMLRRLSGQHGRGVGQLAWGAGGRTLASMSEDAVVLWNVGTGRRIRRFVPEYRFRCMAVSPDRKQLATGSWSDTAAAYDMATGAGKAGPRRITQHGVQALAWSPDGKSLAVAGGESTVQLWDPWLRRSLGKSPRFADSMGILQWSPDGKMLAMISGVSDVILWNVQDRKVYGTLRTGDRAVASAEWNPFSRLLAVGTDQGDSEDCNTAGLWDAVTARRFAALPGLGSTDRLAWSPDGTTLATGSKDDRVRLFAADGRPAGEVRVAAP
jgi:WD40 repeat protein